MASHRNNFGQLRLLLASLVVITHANYLLDAGKGNDPLFRLTHTTTLGDLAVDAFFIVSGYLVSQSLSRSYSGLSYMQKRALRIYPGYIAACAVSLLLGWTTGGNLSLTNLPGTLMGILYLRGPVMDHAFAGAPVTGLNGSLWSISYEFRCYILLLLVSALGLTRNRRLMLALLVILLGGSVWSFNGTESDLSFLVGTTDLNIRTSALFAAGCVCFLFKDRIKYRLAWAAISAVSLCALLPLPRFNTLGIAIFGAYLAFWFAFDVRPGALSKITNETDLSYGVYLYGWPLTDFIIWRSGGNINRWALCVLALATSSLIAYASWTFIEKPALALKSQQAIPADNRTPEHASLTYPPEIAAARRYRDRD